MTLFAFMHTDRQWLQCGKYREYRGLVKGKIRLEALSNMIDMGKKVRMRKRDVLEQKFGTNNALEKARQLLEAKDQSEEAFLGAQVVMLLHGMI